MVATLLTDRLIPRGRDLRFGGRPRPSASVHDMLSLNDARPSRQYLQILDPTGYTRNQYIFSAQLSTPSLPCQRGLLLLLTIYHTSSSIFTIAATTACCQKQQQNNIMMSSGNKMPLPLGQQHQKQNHHPIQNTIVSPSFGGAFIKIIFASLGLSHLMALAF